MKIGVIKETQKGEKRVAISPNISKLLIEKGFELLVEEDAGLASSYKNSDYESAGAKIVSRETLFNESTVLIKINPFDEDDLKLVNNTQILMSQLYYKSNAELIKSIAATGATAFSMDAMPRISRAQDMDVLSSQSNLAGYKAVIVGANEMTRIFPLMMTAAGTIIPSKVLIYGVGVAGLQAIATAKRLGAVVEVFDTRPAVKEEVMSLGAKFVEVEGAADASSAGGYAVEQTEEYKQKQQQRIAESVAKSDIIITTAQIPGKKAPILITEEMLNSMRDGSVIIDLAASTGGNTPHTKNNETVIYNGISIIGNSSLQSTMPSDASKLYGKNVSNFLQLIIDKEANLNLNWEDDLVKGACITHNGEIINDRVKSSLSHAMNN